MSINKKNFIDVLSSLDKWANYENSSKFRDISKLEGIQLLLNKLGNPEKKFKIIHIAGTNGKGSTAIIISHLLKFQGFSTGCYTSPHLIDIRERIRINGKKVSKKNFTESAFFVMKIAKSFKGNPKISYFDLLTAIAFHVFMIKKMEWIVLETGLGGRLDSTNVTNKELCILTRIGLDHQDILGLKLKDIVKEKIGITRPKIPTIISHQENKIKELLKNLLKENNVPFYFVEKYFKKKFPENYLTPKKESAPQFENILTSLCAMQILFDGSLLQKKKWLKTAQKIKISGRLDLRKNVLWGKKSKYFKKILIDGSHNKDSILALEKFISENEIIPFNLILGMSSDKLVSTIKKQLRSLIKKADKIILTSFSSPRSISTKKLEKFIFGSTDLINTPHIKHVKSIEQALEICVFECEKTIVIAGSFYLVGDFLKIFKS